MKILGIYLFIWYIVSLFTSCLEYQYDCISLIAFYFRQLSNIVTIVFLGFTINRTQINSHILVLGLLLIVWFINIIPIDASGIYNIYASIFFVLIDILTYIYISLYLIENKIHWYDLKTYLKDLSNTYRFMLPW